MSKQRALYPSNVYKHDANGKLALDVNGNLLVEHYAGEEMSTADGQPIYISTSPDAPQKPNVSVEAMTDSELVDLQEQLSLEKAARVGKVGLYRQQKENPDG